MNQVARVFVVINLLLAASFLAAAATFLKQSDDWKGQYNQAETDHATALNAKDSEIKTQQEDLHRYKEDVSKLEKRVDSLKSDKTTLQTQLDSANGSSADSKRREEALQSTHDGAVARLNEITNHLGTIDGLVDKYKDEAVKAMSARDEAIKERMAAVASLENERDTVHQRDKDIVALKGQLNEKAAVLTTYTNVYPPPGATVRKKIDGQVLQYRAASNVVQINAGKSKGVVVGHEFDILRGSQFICTVKVDRVEDDSCVGHMTNIRSGSQTPRGGDQATTL